MRMKTMHDKEFFKKVKREDKIWVLYKDKAILCSEIENGGNRLFVWDSKKKVELYKAHDEKNDAYRPIYISVDSIKRTWLNDSKMNIKEIFVNSDGFGEKYLCYSKEEFLEELK